MSHNPVTRGLRLSASAEPSIGSLHSDSPDLASVEQVMPEQEVTYTSGRSFARRHCEGISSLYMQVLTSAILDMFRAGTEVRGKRQRDQYQREAEEWFASESRDDPMDAECVFEALGLDRKRAYAHLRATRSAWIKERLTPAEFRKRARKELDIPDMKGARHKIVLVRRRAKDDLYEEVDEDGGG